MLRQRHVFSTHKALKPFALHTFSSLDGLICKQLEYFHSIQEKRQSLLYSILNSNKYMRSAYATIILARLRRQELLDTLPKKTTSIRTPQNKMSPVIYNQIKNNSETPYGSNTKALESFTPHILLLMFNLHANQILPLRSGDKSELIYKVLCSNK